MTPQVAPAATPDARPDARRIQVRKSGVHGKGVFALKPIAKGESIIEYKGQIIDWPEALRRHPHDPADPNHTFYFSLDDGSHVIDARVGGNAARWINHACMPNCVADETEGRIFIKALRKLKAGEELFYDYGLVIDERYTPRLKKDYECRCGSAVCRHTMLAPKRAADHAAGRASNAASKAASKAGSKPSSKPVSKPASKPVGKPVNKR